MNHGRHDVPRAHATPEPSSVVPRALALAALVIALAAWASRPARAASATPRDTSRVAPVMAIDPDDDEESGDEHAGVQVGGYGEVVLQRFDARRNDGRRSRLRPVADAQRAVIEVERQFDPTLRFESEFEFEHGGVVDEAPVAVDTATGGGTASLSGEATLEYAWLEWRPSRGLGARAGVLVIPVGFLSENHEPTRRLGALRPDVETRIIPSTWTAVGAGLVGESGRLAWRAYLTEGLDASRFTAAGGIREGRQGGRQADATHLAVSARADLALIERAETHASLGGAAFAGDAWQGPQPATGALRPTTTVAEAHATIACDRLEARALYAWGTIQDHLALSRALGVYGTSEAIGRRFFGGYVEAGWKAASGVAHGSRWSLEPWARVDESDTQDAVGAAGTENPAHHQRTVSAGLDAKPHPDVALKLERQWRWDEAEQSTDQWNASLAWAF